MIGIFEQAALKAGRAIMEVYAAGAHVTIKADSTPVTEADRQAEAIILSELAAAFPGVPVVAEEAVAADSIPETGDAPFFLVDPLDGTKEFIARHDDFTVNIAYVEKGVPVAGIVYAPALHVGYTGGPQGAEKLAIGADCTIRDRRAIAARPCPADPLALVSRSHNSPETLAFLSERGVTRTRTIGSSLKFCLLAEGAADLYPRFSRTMEWDTAAGDAVLRAAGGTVTDPEGRPLAYGKAASPRFSNPFFIAFGKPAASRSPSGSS